MEVIRQWSSLFKGQKPKKSRWNSIHYPPLKSFNMKVNNDHYRHTNAERLHHQQTHYTRNAKGILQEEQHHVEIWMYAQGGRKREMVSVWGK